MVQDKSRITTIVSKSITSWQSPFHEVFEYSEDREEFFSSGEDDVIYMIRSEGTWFRIRVMESTCDGITYYSPIVEYRDGDAPPKCFVIE